MLKSVFKEIVIILLLAIAILLILGILFYDYIPINRVIPEREAYTTPNEVREEIDEAITETEKVEVTYEVTDSDLNIYKQEGSYSEGKANPFLLSSGSATTGGDGTSNVSDNNGNSGDNNSDDDSNQNNEQTDKNSTGTFFNDEGIK